VRHCATPSRSQPPTDPSRERLTRRMARATGTDYLSSLAKYLAITAHAQVVVTVKRTALLFARYGSTGLRFPPILVVGPAVPRREDPASGLPLILQTAMRPGSLSTMRQ
jgi:hypothetical protein